MVFRIQVQSRQVEVASAEITDEEPRFSFYLFQSGLLKCYAVCFARCNGM